MTASRALIVPRRRPRHKPPRWSNSPRSRRRAADAVYVGERSKGSVSAWAPSRMSSQRGEEIGLRVFVGRRNATISASDLSQDALATLVERAVAMARAAPEDQYAGFAPEELLFRGEPADLDLDDGGDPDPAELKARALTAEDAARSLAGITNSNGSSASASASIFAMATSHGFAAATRATGYSNSVSIVAGEAGAMQRDYAWHSARHMPTLRLPRPWPARVAAGGCPHESGRHPPESCVDVRPRVATPARSFRCFDSARQFARHQLPLDARRLQCCARVTSTTTLPRALLRSRSLWGRPAVRPRTCQVVVLTRGWRKRVARQLGLSPTGHAGAACRDSPARAVQSLFCAGK